MNSLTKCVSSFPVPSSSRPVVFYREDMPHLIELGKPAFIYPLNHPDTENVTGDGHTPASTSPVKMVNLLTGEFWTHNTHYAPLWLPLPAARAANPTDPAP